MSRTPVVALLTALVVASLAPAEPVTKEIKLFNGKDLTNFYTYLRGHGKNVDPNKVFTVADGMIRVSGQTFGCFTTEKEFDGPSATCATFAASPCQRFPSQYSQDFVSGIKRSRPLLRETSRLAFPASVQSCLNSYFVVSVSMSSGGTSANTTSGAAAPGGSIPYR